MVRLIMTISVCKLIAPLVPFTHMNWNQLVDKLNNAFNTPTSPSLSFSVKQGRSPSIWRPVMPGTK